MISLFLIGYDKVLSISLMVESSVSAPVPQALIVLRHLAVLLLFLDLLDCIPADGSDCHLGIFALFAHSLHKLLAAFLGQFRKNKAGAFAVVGGVDAEVGFLDRLFERVKHAQVIRRDDKKARFGEEMLPT